MGTNYYLKRPETLDMHIGKSSGGWCFSLRVYPELDIHSLEAWLPLWLKGEIFDEYGKKVSIEELLSVIVLREWAEPRQFPNRQYVSEADFLIQNQAVRGPKGLTRHQIDNFHCIGHGSGTWDLIVGEFC